MCVKVLSWSKGHIHARVAGNGFLPWFLTGFYGHPVPSLRVQSWELLRRLGKDANGGWMCMGDFNEIIGNYEKVGGNLRSIGAMNRFREVLDDCRLIDFGQVKNEMTWRNKVVLERLDRCLCNWEWLNIFPNARVSVLDWWCSDHRPLLIDCPSLDTDNKCGKVNRKTRFHFEEAWCDDENCKVMISNIWKNKLNGGCVQQLKNRLKKCGNQFDKWNKKKRKELNSKVRESKNKLAYLSSLNDPMVWREIKDEEQVLNSLTEKNEIFWRQRSRALWLKWGDKNTKYFHHKASVRRRKNEILGLKDEAGIWQDEEAIVTDIINRYFQNLFKSSCPDSVVIEAVTNCLNTKVTNSMNNILMYDFCENDICEAVKEMNPTKAPGEDGLPALFYQKFWETIKNDIVAVCLNILNNNAYLDCLNDTLIALIPKVE